MSDYFIILLTAENCGHCMHTRGDGFINNGKHLTSTNFLKKLLTAQPGLELLNIHFSNMAANLKNIKDVSKIYLNDNKIFQEKIYQYNKFTKVDVYQENGQSNKKIFSDYIINNKIKVDWFNFLDKKIPHQLINYAYFFPCFLIAKRKDWNTSLHDIKSQLLAWTNAGYTVEDNMEI